MTSGPTELPPPVARLDPPGVIAALARDHGIHLELVGAAAGGEVGAAYVRWPDGRDGVVTRAGDASAESGDQLRLTADVLVLARERGVPAPRYDLIIPLAGTHAVVQERLGGAEPQVVDTGLVDQMVAVTEPWCGLLTDRDDLEPASLHLTESGPGFCLHESLQHVDARTRRLLEQVREIGRSGLGTIEGGDLMHLDYHGGNVLVDGAGRITGVIDWDGWARGDRWFSLEVLSFDLAWRGVDSDVRRRLDERIAGAVPADRLRAYRASLALRQVDWAIRHHEPHVVDFWLGVADDRLGSHDD